MPKIAVITILYAAVFLLLVYVQFSRQLSFSRRVGNFVVSGQMRESAEGGDSGSHNDYLIDQYAKVSFGGLDFMLSNDANNPIYFIDEDGNKASLIVDTLSISNDTAHFLLSDGAELVFYTQKSTDTDGLLISGILPEKASVLYLPYLPASYAEINIDDAGHWKVVANDVNFIFNRQPDEGVGRQLILSRDDSVVFYHTEQEATAFNPVAFTVRGGMEKIIYEEQLKQWLDKVYSVWDVRFSSGDSETLITAFLAETAFRGAYPSFQAAPAIQPFRTSPAQTYLSAPFLGRLDVALRTLTSTESVQSAQITELLRSDTSNLLNGNPFFKSLLLVPGGSLIKAQGALAATTEPADITLTDTLGILDGYEGWPVYAPGQENPFSKLLPRALELISERLVKDSSQTNVFVTEGKQVDVEFNLRLGLALTAYGDQFGALSWAGIGRSIVLSVLAQTDDEGMLPSFLTIDDAGQIQIGTIDENAANGENGAIAENEVAKIDAVQLYHLFPTATYYPRAVDLGSVRQGVWVWTAASNVNATFQNNILDVGITFPTGWTHYLLIRGVAPFAKIQLRNMDYRSDPRFEQYNSPGWVYSASAQTLLVKLVHRSDDEHIRIFY
ncbi:MAG: hypothetical protein LBK61_04370 [Spirochaetaceae bacterium]|nr:hypothetical protein [Spirochaetaceae bacterium]